MMQLAFDFSVPPVPLPKLRKPMTVKQQRAADAVAEESRIQAYWAAQRERDRLEARAFWKVGMVVSMPLWATVLDSPQKYTQCLPGVVETIDGDKANVRLYVAPEYGCWLDKYPLHMKLAVDVLIPDTDPPLYVAIGTPETIGKLIEVAERPPGYLADSQIAAGAAVECDHGQPIGRNVAIDVFDAMKRAADQEGGAA